MKLTCTVLASLALGMSGAAGDLKPKIEDLGWMAGDWKCEVWGGTFEERWSQPAGGTMVGMGRHLKDGKTGFMEFLSIETSDSGLTMWILLGAPSQGQKSGVPFRLTSWKDGEAVFESPSNDFPSKISYKRMPNGSLFCRIEGEQGGKKDSQDFNFKRIRA